MKAPYLSVIIPTLNEEKFLPNLLEDLKRQKENDFETIVVDGDSDDETKRTLMLYNQRLKIHFFNIHKRNVSAQRNFGATKAKGEYLIFLDADSRVNPFFIKKLKHEIKKNKYLVFLPTLLPQDKNYENLVVFNLANFFIELSQMVGKPFSAGGSMIFQKDFFQFIGGFNEKLFLAEDHEIIQRARRFGVIAKLSKNIKVKFSLRRMKKEGRLDLFRKYLVAAVHTIVKGGVDKKIFEYQMGGRYHLTKNKSMSLDKTIKDYFSRIKKQLRNLIMED